MADEDQGFKLGRVQCVWQTPNAIKCRMLEDGILPIFHEFWVPQSHVHDNSEVYEKGQQGKLVVTSWLAKKEGWEDA